MSFRFNPFTQKLDDVTTVGATGIMADSLNVVIADVKNGLITKIYFNIGTDGLWNSNTDNWNSDVANWNAI